MLFWNISFEKVDAVQKQMLRKSSSSVDFFILDNSSAKKVALPIYLFSNLVVIYQFTNFSFFLNTKSTYFNFFSILLILLLFWLPYCFISYSSLLIANSTYSPSRFFNIRQIRHPSLLSFQSVSTPPKRPVLSFYAYSMTLCLRRNFVKHKNDRWSKISIIRSMDSPLQTKLIHDIINLEALFYLKMLSYSSVTNKKHALYKKWSFTLRIFSVNVTKSSGNCGFGHIYWRNL